MPANLRPAALSAAVLFALAGANAASARELAAFDINAASMAGKRDVTVTSSTPASPRVTTDAIGREAFSWVQRDLPAQSKAMAVDAESAARLHLAALLPQQKRPPAAIDSLQLKAVDMLRGDAAIVRLQPRLNGVALFHEELALLMDGEQRLVAMRGPLPQTAPSDAKRLPGFALTAGEAISAALRDFDFTADVQTALRPGEVQGEYQTYHIDPAKRSRSGALADGDLRAKRVYFRTADGLQPAWYVESRIADAAGKAGALHAHVVSAVDGSLLFRLHLGADASAYSYRVWAEEGGSKLPLPSPLGRALTPDPDGAPSNNSAAAVTPELRSLANAPFSRAATDGWLPDGASTTSGNNVIAYADRVEPSGFGSGDLQPSATSPGSFDYSFTLSLDPLASVTQAHAATVQAFYVVNWLHDWFYDHGFAEVDGNAQLNNFGRGGLGTDPLVVETQDYDTPNNANMSTPADGRSPRMQMGIWNGTPKRDSSLDTETVAHEWGHYLSNRLVGDASGLSTEHARGMGEGWADFVAQLVTVKEEDKSKPGNAQFNGAYGSSGWAANRSYYGVRRYPYSTDLSKNPLSLRHVSDGVFMPIGVPVRFGSDGANNSEVHNQGEVWASALWEAYAALLNDSSRLSFAQAQSRMKDYLVAGLKLTPVAPTMTEARDAILASVLASGETADFALIRDAFAKRGLGAGALIPDRYSDSMFGVVESTSLGSDIAVGELQLSLPMGCDSDSVLDVGETAMLTVTLNNSGFADLREVTANLSASNPALSFPAGDQVSFDDIPLFGSVQASVPVQLTAGVARNTPISVLVTPTAADINSPPGAAASLSSFVNFDEATQSSNTATFEGLQAEWVNSRDPMGGGTARWAKRVESGQHFLHGSDLNSRSATWVETPLIAVGNEPLVLTLKHRYAFETDSEENYDGGLIQVSTDGGVSWSDIDPTTAGYAAGTLSDCCGNPLAGKRAYLGMSTAYPNFVDTAINFGTLYAGQSRLKFRFGVATDAAVNQDGWDIHTASVSGATNTPFSAIVDQSASCSADNGKALQEALAGTYYSSDRSGEGVLLDLGRVGDTPVLFFTWYTYENGEQQWLVGNQVYSGAQRQAVIPVIGTRGARFGSEFRAEDVAVAPWGEVAVSFPDCDHLQLTYQKQGGETGSLLLERGLQRLESAQCGTLHGGLSGTFYSDARSGEGVLVDFGKVGEQPVQFFTWYTYENGAQQWLVGSQPFNATDAAVEVDLINTRGAQFGASFRADEVQTTPWGTVRQRYLDCDTLLLEYSKTGGESGELRLSRGLQRSGSAQCE